MLIGYEIDVFNEIREFAGELANLVEYVDFVPDEHCIDRRVGKSEHGDAGRDALHSIDEIDVFDASDDRSMPPIPSLRRRARAISGCPVIPYVTDRKSTRLNSSH